MFEVFACSETGLRDTQQDAYALSERCLVVADGMGGLEGGAIAAQVAVRVIVDELEEGDDLESAVGWACREIEANGGGGTTLVVALLTEEKQLSARIGWVGDSRAYVVRRDEVELLSQDHLGEDGGLTRWLPDEGTVDVVDVFLEAGEHLVLCTDGVTGDLDEEMLLQIGEQDDPAEWLVEAALDAGASDNCTAVVCRVV